MIAADSMMVVSPSRSAGTAPSGWTVRRDQLLHDPDHTTRLLPAFDSGDHLHPNDAGYAAGATAIPFSTLGIR
jgi:hypothetical protein